MVEVQNNEVHCQKPQTWGMVAMFLAGVGVATTVAILAARTHGDKMARQAENVLEVCDRAMQTLEQRVQSVDVALTG